MEKIIVELENCYGIKNLKHEFDFSQGDTKIIYAPNGVMKSSFANTLDDYSKGEVSKDRINPSLQSVRNIKNQMDIELEKESIFVVKPFEKSFKTNRISTLLVNNKLKEKYDQIYGEISEENERLIKDLKVTAGIKKDLQKKLCESFKKEEKDFVTLLMELEKKVNEEIENTYNEIKYNDIFDSRITNFIKTEEFQRYITDYLNKYEELVSESKLFKKGFNHNNAANIQKQLQDNGYFEAEHSVILKIDGERVEIDNSVNLSERILEEQNRILENDELKSIFNKIDKKLTNIQLKEFRDLLLEKPEILPELKNLNELRMNLWVSYLAINKEQFNVVISKYKRGQVKLKSIVEEAKEESTEWEKVVTIFNSRFHVPYKVRIANREDSIIKDSAPNINYFYENDSENSCEVEEDLLWEILSQGEKRTLYLLNIIFEIESRKEANINTLFIVDDIADSFDYKNKYAIIEYLKEIADNPLFKMVILTHNFDFLRTLQTRVCQGNEKYSSTFMAMKEEDKLILQPWKFNYISNPLKAWKRNLQNEVKLIASITFARNLAEYTDDNKNFDKLTEILHIKTNTKSMNIKDIETIYTEIFTDFKPIDVADKTLGIYNIIMENASIIAGKGIEGINLEEKIVLSIALRLLAEEYMIHKINDDEKVKAIKRNQTAELYSITKELDGIEECDLGVLEKVIIMTPENIHLNSFMFEPLLDMSNLHLINLFKDLEKLTESLIRAASM